MKNLFLTFFLDRKSSNTPLSLLILALSAFKGGGNEVLIIPTKHNCKIEDGNQISELFDLNRVRARFSMPEL